MQDKVIEKLVQRLSTEMFKWWRRHRCYGSGLDAGYDAGFSEEHEQTLYDALNDYLKKEKLGW